MDVATRYQCRIRLEHDGRTANAKALASLLRLGIGGGEAVRLQADGPDAEEAISALRRVIAFDLAELAKEISAGREPAAPYLTTDHTLVGVSASPGIALGSLFQVQPSRILVVDVPTADPQVERLRLEQAIETAWEQLGELHDAVRARAGDSEAAIFHAHQAMVSDPDLKAEAIRLIDAGHSAAWAWQTVTENRADGLRRLGDERLAARAVDLHDVGQRVLRALSGPERTESQLPLEPVILVADDLVPSETAKLDPGRTLGICTAYGGPTSHTAIIARALGIPAVVGAGPHVLELPDGTSCILDGTAGRLHIDPTRDEMEAAHELQADIRGRRREEFHGRFEPAVLTDGARIRVLANIASIPEAGKAVEWGSEGIGLTRTEFLFLDRDSAPSEDEQYRAYGAIARDIGGLPLIIRTFDVGGDKSVPYLPLPRESNPALGLRGVRLSLRKPELFEPQLRAIYRLAADAPVKIMFPMVATLEELRGAREIAERVRRDLDAPHVEIGIMIEVPSAVAMADHLAAEVDFFSIGTNDLSQYVLGIDRMHPTLGHQLDGLHPAVLRMIQHTVQAANQANIPVSVCGGIAGEPLGALVLAGIGVSDLSMGLPSIPGVKAFLRVHSLQEARALAERALTCGSAAEVRRLGDR